MRKSKTPARPAQRRTRKADASSRAAMQPPFRQVDLLPTDRFVSHCAKLGIRTSREQLEFCDRHDLIIPAVRVDPGYIAYRKVLLPEDGRLQWRMVYADDLAEFSPEKVDRRTYYGFGTVTSGSRDWLDKYKRRGMVTHPTRFKYRPWREDVMVRRTELPTSLKELGEGAIDFYAANQCFALRHVQARLVVEVRDAALFMDESSWAATGGRLREAFVPVLGPIRDTVREEYRIAALLNGLQDISDEIDEGAQASFHASMEDGQSREDAKRDARSSALLYMKDSAPAKVAELVGKLRYETDDIRMVRQRAAHQAAELDPTHRWTEFTSRIPSDLLQRVRGDYALALEYYGIVDDLKWLLERLGDQPPSLKKLLTGADKERHCLVCGELFEGKRRTQVTCAQPACVRAHKNEHKRRRRHLP